MKQNSLKNLYFTIHFDKNTHLLVLKVDYFVINVTEFAFSNSYTMLLAPNGERNIRKGHYHNITYFLHKIVN